MVLTQSRSTKHGSIFTALLGEIQGGKLKPGDRLPSEAELVRRFGVSRITVSRAVKDLQAQNLVERRAGSGTFVKGRVESQGLMFGVLIPDFGETEIFEPICQGMMESPSARSHALLWGGAKETKDSPEERTWQLCVQYIQRRVGGVFFAPLENAPGKDATNRRVISALADARIPVVLLDRSVTKYPDSGHLDLVGIDNRRAGYLITEHLLKPGCRKVAFIGMKNVASTVDEREAGYREALYQWGVTIDRNLIHRLDAADTTTIEALMNSLSPKGIVCANDRTAAQVMKTLLQLGHRVPEDVRIVGIDDVEFASLLPSPLTTLRQPTREIGDTALTVMLERVARPDLPPRETRLHGKLIIRESCGSRLKS